MSKGKSLKNLISGDSITVIPGVYDSLSGLLASKAGFDAIKFQAFKVESLFAKEIFLSSRFRGK